MMTGTTAITRVLAYKISIKGMDYPIGAVEDWFKYADLKHVSNESPLVEGCPVPDEFSSSLVFCTPPEMIEVLDLLGINVIEMTGNHINDHGPENLEYTLNIYADRGWYVYAAGINPEEARSPVLIESNGNKIGFLGCNAVGPATVYAKDERPGAAECDFEYLTQKIQELKQQGYVVVTTYQHEEEDNLMYFEKISKDFQGAAAAGADIVQGSQAHSPMGIEFVEDNFIHYGLGNFLFDQMVEKNRREIIDRHIIYNGDYINTELLTALLVDWSRPTPMTEGERTQLLEEIFDASLKRKNEN
jgi:poly-gamma-glutamate synthesis protein (capsule biosynthesis protein)